jgi:hypothetical protein
VLLALPIFIVVNFASLVAKPFECVDCYGEFGFPLHALWMNYFPLVKVNSWLALIVGLAFAIICGVACTWLFALIFRRRSTS